MHGKMVIVQLCHGITAIFTPLLIALNDIKHNPAAITDADTRQSVTFRTAIDNLTLVHTGY
jgi:hypothetical protein